MSNSSGILVRKVLNLLMYIVIFGAKSLSQDVAMYWRAKGEGKAKQHVFLHDWNIVTRKGKPRAGIALKIQRHGGRTNSACGGEIKAGV